MDYCVFSSGAQDGGLSDTNQAAYCAMDNIPSCCGICPNTDLSGIGVRSAFYLQALMNAILIVISPEEGAEAAWASTILTGALVIPAMIQKFQEQMSLHHATLVLNFATLSTIATVATAPMVPIWRKKGGAAEIAEAYKRASRGEKKAAEENSRRGRVVLSVVLLAQIILQWAWAVIVFVHPYYGQAPCSASTTIVFLFGAYTAEEINEKHFALWTFWLFLCLASSLAWGIIMVFSCINPVHQLPRPSIAEVPDNNRRTLRGRMRQASMFVRVDKDKDRYAMARLLNRISNAVAGMVVLMFIIISEKQIKVNNMLPGENNLWSFSQLAALMLAVAPVWPLAISYFSKAHDKKERRKQDQSINCVTSPPPIGAQNGNYGGNFGGVPMTPTGRPPTPIADEPITNTSNATAVNSYFLPAPAPVIKKRGPSASVSFAEPPNFRTPNSSSSVNVLALHESDEPGSVEPAGGSSSTAVPPSMSIPTRRPPPRRQKAIPASETTAVWEDPPDPSDPFGLQMFGRRSPGSEP